MIHEFAKMGTETGYSVTLAIGAIARLWDTVVEWGEDKLRIELALPG